MDTNRQGRTGIALVAVTAALALLAVVVFVPRDPDLPGSATERRDVAPRTADGLAASEVRDGHARRDAVGAPGWFLRGECVAAETGQPLEDAEWTVAIAGADAAGSSHAGARLRYRIPSEAAGRWTVRVAAPGRIPLLCRLVPRAGEDTGLGVVKLRRGVFVRGTVRDSNGQPVASARIQLRSTLDSYRTGPMLEVASRERRTTIDGGFELDHPIAPGTYRVDLRDAPRRVSAAEVQITPETVSVDVVCAVEGPKDSIRGFVRDSRGAPAEGVVVEAARSDGSGFRVSTRTREDGTFALFRPASLLLTAPVFVGMSSSDGGEQLERKRCEWGQQDLEFVLRAAQRLRVTCAVAGTGEPVTGFAVQCFPMRGAYGFNPMRADSTEHRDGVAWVDDLRPGRYLVVVHPRGAWEGRCVPTLPFSCELLPGRVGDVRVELREKRPFAIHVAYRDQSPAPGSTVALFALHRADRLHAKLPVTDLRTFFQEGGTRGPFAVRLAQVQTDAQGLARLDWTPSDELLVLRVEGEHPLYVENGVRFLRRGEQKSVVLERGGELRGRLVPDGHLPLLQTMDAGELEHVAALRRQAKPEEATRFAALRATGITLVETGGAGRRLPWRQRTRYPIGSDGRFAIRGIPGGRWRVFLERRAHSGGFEEIGPLAEVTIRAGQRLERDFDLRGFLRRGVVVGDVRHNGVPPQAGEVCAVWIDRNGTRHVAARVRCDPVGHFLIEGLLPRPYRMELCYGADLLPLGRPFELPAGGRHTLAGSIRTRPVLLRLGAKAAGQRIVVRGESGAGQGMRFRRRIDAEGVLHLRYVLPGTYQIEGSKAAPLVVEPGDSTQEFVRSYSTAR